MSTTPKKTSRTRNLLGRVEQVCKLLLCQDMTNGELADSLCVTPSGMRNYLAHLRRADLVEIIGKKNFGKGNICDLLRIKRDEKAIEAMLKRLNDEPRQVW